MSTETTNITPSTEGKGNKRGFYIGLILLLFLLNGFFAYLHYQSSQEAETLAAQKVELEAEFAALDAEYNLTLGELETLSTEYTNLQVSSTEEMEKLRTEIEELMAKNAKSKNDISYLRKQLNKYKAESKRVSEELEAAKAQIAKLETSNDSLTVGLSASMAQNSELMTQTEILGKKVELGSLLLPSLVTASGVKYKGSGKEVPTTKAKKAQKIKVCYTVADNKVADPGSKTLYMRLINPEGSTIAIEAQGSGIFAVRENGGEELQYTLKADFEYNNTAQNLCLFWSADNTQFSKGSYTAIFYQDGYKLSETDFELF